MCKITVIIPTYNRAYILKQAIESVLTQTALDLELLVIDDGSIDDTRTLVESITDKRVRYLYKENGGVSSARNLGMASARGEYIAFLDSDDIWPENFVEVMTESLDKNRDYDFAYTATTLLYPDGKREESSEIDRCVSGQLTVQLFKHSFIWPMAVTIRKSVVEGFWFDENLKVCDDNDAFMRLSVRTKFLFVPEIQVLRRWSQDSHSLAAYTESSYVRALSLERFYFQLGGDELVPASVANKKIGHVYRRAGERHRKEGYRTASIALLKRALKYRASDLRLYPGLMKAILLNGEKDRYPHWQMPEKLGPPLCTVHAAMKNNGAPTKKQSCDLQGS